MFKDYAVWQFDSIQASVLKHLSTPNNTSQKSIYLSIVIKHYFSNNLTWCLHLILQMDLLDSCRQNQVP